jgi:hypothetical protein
MTTKTASPSSFHPVVTIRPLNNPLKLNSRSLANGIDIKRLVSEEIKILKKIEKQTWKVIKSMKKRCNFNRDVKYIKEAVHYFFSP